MWLDNNLDSELYPYVQERMLSKTPGQLHRRSGARDIHSRTFHTPRLATLKTVDMSFARQIHDVTARADVVTGGYVTSSPDLFLLTLRSAVPLADAIRGYYEKYGYEPPDITYIKVPKTGNYEEFKKECEKEIDRLTPIVSSTTHTCIVDQFVATGNTLKQSVALANQAAGNSLSGTVIRGDWYGQANNIGPLSIENMTSRHARFMTEIGHLAADQFIK